MLMQFRAICAALLSEQMVMGHFLLSRVGSTEALSAMALTSAWNTDDVILSLSWHILMLRFQWIGADQVPGKARSLSP